MTEQRVIKKAAAILDAHSGMTDRSAQDGCSCGQLRYDEGQHQAEELAKAGLLASDDHYAQVSEAYQRGHEDGFWNGKTTDMSPADAAKFMAPYRATAERLARPLPDRETIARAIAAGYEPDHPEPNRHDLRAADAVLELLTQGA